MMISFTCAIRPYWLLNSGAAQLRRLGNHRAVKELTSQLTCIQSVSQIMWSFIFIFEQMSLGMHIQKDFAFRGSSFTLTLRALRPWHRKTQDTCIVLCASGFGLRMHVLRFALLTSIFNFRVSHFELHASRFWLCPSHTVFRASRFSPPNHVNWIENKA